MNVQIIDFEKLSPGSRAVAECVVLAARFDVLSNCDRSPDQPYPHSLKVELIDRWGGLSEAERGAIADLRNGKLIRWGEWLQGRIWSALQDLPQLVLLERHFGKPLSDCHDFPWRVYETRHS